MANRHTITDLYQMQSLPLSAKVRMTARRIDDWVNQFGEDGVYVSFSGGKDSTVLAHIVRLVSGYRNIPLVFVDVPTQYPELKQFAMTFDNLEILKPKISFAEVCSKYGFPLFSKEISSTVYEARKYFEKLDELRKQNKILTNERTNERTIPYAYRVADLVGIDRRRNKDDEQYKNLKTGNIPNITSRTKMLLGVYPHRENGVETEEYSNMYDRSKYLFMLEAKFDIGSQCCSLMKKEPVHAYFRKTGRKPITAQMASESKLRTQKWLQNGCNGFDLKIPTSNPMSFWTEQDVLLYIKENNLPICSVYGDVVIDYLKMGQCENQMSFANYGIFDNERPLLKTTGCQRTGCVLCGFGCHLEKEPNQRFVNLKETHPKFHNLLYILKNNGVTYAEAIDWVNEHGGFNIKY